MTTVVIDCVNMEVATDSQVTSYFQDKKGKPIDHTTHYKDDSTKLHIKDGLVFAGAGNTDGLLQEYQEVVNTGCLRIKPKSEYTIALIRRKGDHLHIDLHKSEKKSRFGLTWYKVSTETIVSNSQFVTFGSGGEYAFAGLKAGLNAQDAVKLAAKCCPYTNSKVQYYKFKENNHGIS